MSARDELREYADRYGYTEHVNALLDAHRAEVLNEAADAIVTENDRMLWASTPGQHWAADLLRRMATAAPVPVKTAEPLRGRALLDAKTVAEAEATHWRRLGITPETRRCTCGNAAYEQMYDRRVPCKPDCERKGGAS